MPLLLQGTHKIFKGKFYVESLPEFVCVCVVTGCVFVKVQMFMFA